MAENYPAVAENYPAAIEQLNLDDFGNVHWAV